MHGKVSFSTCVRYTPQCPCADDEMTAETGRKIFSARVA